MPDILLYPHQEEALAKMRDGCILNGGVGSGKSRMSLSYFHTQMGGTIGRNCRMMDEDRVLDLYIITTARKRDEQDWEKEMLPFLLSSEPGNNYYKNKVVVDSWNNIGRYKDVKDAFFIFDEQKVKGTGAWVKTFLRIAKTNRWILLSATPGDTWSDYIPVFIANGFYRNRTEFLQEHAIYSRYAKYPKIDRYIGLGRLVRLRDRVLVDVNFERKTVSHDEDVEVLYDRDIYKTAARTRWDLYKQQPMQNAGDLCRVWRQIVNSDFSRERAMLELVDKHKKVIIFYNFNYELDILRNAAYPEGTRVAEWNGWKHEEIPATERWVYLVQYTAGCEGWNCITTDTTIFYSQTYSYNTLEQAKGRINRLNTPYTDLYYYHLKSRAPIDLAIEKALKGKKDFNEGKFVKW